MFGRCEAPAGHDLTCGRIAVAEFEIIENARPYEIVGADDSRRYGKTKEKRYRRLLCAECGFGLINKKYANLMDRGLRTEHWVRGDYYKSISMIQLLPSGEAWIAMAKTYNILRDKEEAEAKASRRSQSPRYTVSRVPPCVRPAR
jgi:hypothetical protein